MTAKSKRPFFVFAAVAFLCCMVMLAGVRGSRADDGRSPVAGPGTVDRAPTLVPTQTDPIVPRDRDPGATGAPGPGASDGADAAEPGLDRPPLASEVEGLEAPERPESGVGVLEHLSDLTGPPPAVVDPDVVLPDAGDEPLIRGRGHKKGKDKGKGKDGHGGPPGPEPPGIPGIPVNPTTPEIQAEDPVGPEVEEPTP